MCLSSMVEVDLNPKFSVCWNLSPWTWKCAVHGGQVRPPGKTASLPPRCERGGVCPHQGRVAILMGAFGGDLLGALQQCRNFGTSHCKCGEKEFLKVRSGRFSLKLGQEVGETAAIRLLLTLPSFWRLGAVRVYVRCGTRCRGAQIRTLAAQREIQT